MTMHKIKSVSELQEMLTNYLEECVKLSREEGIDTSLVSNAFFGEFMQAVFEYMAIMEKIFKGHEEERKEG